MEATVITAETVDGEYRALCAEIGQLYVQRCEAHLALESLDEALKSKRQALLQVVARHRAVAHNESLQASKKGLKSVEDGRGK